MMATIDVHTKNEKHIRFRTKNEKYIRFHEEFTEIISFTIISPRLIADTLACSTICDVWIHS